jgi:hypothetical protein
MRQQIPNARRQFEQLARAIFGDRVVDSMRPGESAAECARRLKKETRERAEKIRKARVS